MARCNKQLPILNQLLDTHAADRKGARKMGRKLYCTFFTQCLTSALKSVFCFSVFFLFFFKSLTKANAVYMITGLY